MKFNKLMLWLRWPVQQRGWPLEPLCGRYCISQASTLKEQMILNQTSTWMKEVVRHLRDGVLPKDNKEAEWIKHKARWFLWHEDQLYKKSFTHPLLKCVTLEEGDYILREIYHGACVSHQGRRTIVGKALTASYYWPTLKSDAHELIKRCPSCQIHSDIRRAPSTPLTMI